MSENQNEKVFIFNSLGKSFFEKRWLKDEGLTEARLLPRIFNGFNQFLRAN